MKEVAVLTRLEARVVTDMMVYQLKITAIKPLNRGGGRSRRGNHNPEPRTLGCNREKMGKLWVGKENREKEMFLLKKK